MADAPLLPGNEAPPPGRSLCERISAAVETELNQAAAFFSRYRARYRAGVPLVFPALPIILLTSAIALGASAILSTSIIIPPAIPLLLLGLAFAAFIIGHIIKRRLKAPDAHTTYQQFQERHSRLDPGNNKNVLLLLQANCDSNEAFSSMPTYAIKQLENRKDCEIIVKTVSSMGEIKDSIDEISKQNRKIQCLWIAGHGTPQTIRFGH